MKEAVRKWSSVLLAAVLAAAMVFTLPGAVTLPTSAVTRQEINKLKENANSLAAQKKELQNQLAAAAADWKYCNIFQAALGISIVLLIALSVVEIRRR